MALLSGKASTGMLEIMRVNKGARADGLGCPTHRDAIHADQLASSQILRGEFMLGSNRFSKGVAHAIHGNDFASLQRPKCDDEIICWMKTKG